MIKWGLTSGSHDGAISVFDDDNLLFATDFERFSRVKNDKEIPKKLIDYILEKYDYPSKIYFYEDLTLKAERRLFSGQDDFLTIIEPDIKTYCDIEYSEHHNSHASYGFFTSPFEKSLVLVIDAIGEWETLTLWNFFTQDGEYKSYKIKNWKYPKSLGLMYSACTKAAGFKPNEEEYIMMGASSVYPENKKNTNFLRKLWNENFNFHKGVEFNSFKEDIPASAQIFYEEIFQSILNDVVNHSEYNGNLVFCGGCALNVKANRLMQKIDNIYIPCNPGDGGSSIGCVLSRTRKKISPTPYLGYQIEGEYPIDMIINELIQNHIVGVARGRAEFGPRALGNRSIFGDPRKENLKDTLNNIKGRELFRPFGAIILKEDLNEYYEKGINSPYMNCVFVAKEITRVKYPSVVHIDNTTRLQIITDEKNLRNLLIRWKEYTGCPMIINTSLNVKGQPLLNNEKDVMLFDKIKIL